MDIIQENLIRDLPVTSDTGYVWPPENTQDDKPGRIWQATIATSELTYEGAGLADLPVTAFMIANFSECDLRVTVDKGVEVYVYCSQFDGRKIPFKKCVQVKLN